MLVEISFYFPILLPQKNCDIVHFWYNNLYLSFLSHMTVEKWDTLSHIAREVEKLYKL